MDGTEGVAFPPFLSDDSVSVCSIVKIVPSQKLDQAGFVDLNLPPRFLPSKGGGTHRIHEWDTFPRE